MGELLFPFQEAEPLGDWSFGEYVSAGAAGAKLFVVIELLVNLRDPGRDIVRIHNPRKHQFVTFLAEPCKLFFLPRPPPALDDKTPGVLESPRRMRQSARANEDLPLFDLHQLAPFSFRLEMQLHIALDLVEELVAGLYVKIEARVRPAQHHDQEVFVTDNETVRSERRAEVFLVLLDPLP